jgi:hypothetical protein
MELLMFEDSYHFIIPPSGIKSTAGKTRMMNTIMTDLEDMENTPLLIVIYIVVKGYMNK